MKKKKKHERKSVNNQLQASDIEEFNDDMPEEEFKVIIKEPQPPRHKKHKRKNSGTRTRYYDLRLVWLFLLLAGLVLLVRAVICEHFHVLFLNEIDPNSPDGKEFIGHDTLSKSYKQLEGMIMVVEAIVSLIAMVCFVQGPKDKNSRNDGSEMDSVIIWFWAVCIMALPCIITYCVSYWWFAYGVAMLILAFVIGQYEGFALPLFKDFGKNFWYGTKDMKVKYKNFGKTIWYGTKDMKDKYRLPPIFFPGHSAIWVLIICLATIITLLVYYLCKAW
jgi:hypothetical protein